MLTSKQKRYLKSLGSVLDPIVQVGKAGVVPSVVDSTSQALLARELIKIRVLRNSPEEPGDAIKVLAEETDAELVQIIGHNGLLYKRHPEKPRIELPE